MSSLRAIVTCQKYCGNRVISSQINLFAPLLNMMMRRCTLWHMALMRQTVTLSWSNQYMPNPWEILVSEEDSVTKHWRLNYKPRGTVCQLTRRHMPVYHCFVLCKYNYGEVHVCKCSALKFALFLIQKDTYSSSHIVQITDFLEFLHEYSQEKSETCTKF